MRPTPAKIIDHSEGMGAPSPETVRKRARELALINGHRAFSEEDWREAKRELHGGHETNDTNGEMDMASIVSGHDMVAGSVGHHIQNAGTEEQENVGEELIAEGMDEAVHEQMLAARREDVEHDREDQDRDGV